MIVKACLFDLDGTLIDSEVLWVDAIEAALRQKLPSLTREAVEHLVYGRSWPDIYADIARRFPGTYPTRESMEAVTVPLFNDLRRRRDIRIHDSVDLLVRLAARFPVAIVSGSTRERIRESVSFMGIEPQVRLWVGCEDYRLGKPHPEGFLLGAARLGVPPRHCVAFEDSAAGVAAAKAAGMACVALSRSEGVPQDVSAADAVVQSLAQFDVDHFAAQHSLG